MADKKPAQQPVNPKMAAIVAALLALLAVAVAYVPSLKPVCQSLGGCVDPVEDVQLP